MNTAITRTRARGPRPGVVLPALFLACAALGASPAQSAPVDDLLGQAIAGAHRDAANRERDGYRHPRETLKFFGLEPQMTVVEIWPASGWYTELLAPVLHDAGTYYAATFSLTDKSPQYQRDIQKGFLQKLKANPGVYGAVKVTEMGAGKMDIAPPGSADLVVTFRNVHNWLKGGFADDAFRAFYRALKPGGVLGVVEHRAKAGTSMQGMIDSGYVTEAEVRQLAEGAGFRLEARSQINANALDTADHPQGVWSLPPGYAVCKEMKPGPGQDSCRQEYLAIGESDRMTLRFRKPGN